MGLFDSIKAVVNNSNLPANTNELGSIINAAQEVSNSLGVDQQTVNTAMSVVGNFTKSALQQKRDEEGEEAAKSIVSQFSGLSPSTAAITALFSSSKVSEMTNVISEKTGLDPSMIDNILPQLVPLVLNFLNAAGSHPILTKFLDADGDGDVDIADAMQMAAKFLK